MLRFVQLSAYMPEKVIIKLGPYPHPHFLNNRRIIRAFSVFFLKTTVTFSRRYAYI